MNCWQGRGKKRNQGHPSEKIFIVEAYIDHPSFKVYKSKCSLPRRFEPFSVLCPPLSVVKGEACSE